ncbi:MAG: ribosome maturation factor RimM [Duncaniella sp.]|nr:ribosome maturation factor RimM [Duncaniella sp.]
MIKRTDLIEAGKFNKPHGIKGEISVTLDLDVDLAAARCIVIEIDGIFVPFFINGFRPKTAETSLVTIDGIVSEEDIRDFVNKPFFLLRNDPVMLCDDNDSSDNDDEDGYYAADLIGFKVVDSAIGELGTVTDINDSTANVLFVIRRADGSEILIPVADEFIDAIDPDAAVIELSVPEEIINLNSKQL